MPKVTITFEDGRTSTGRGGCFGFMGRYGSIGTDIESFKYHLDHQWTQDDSRRPDYNNRNTEYYDLNPTEFWTWLATESAWSKYVRELTSNHHEVVISTDCPGHAVIGTASMFRLGCKENTKFIGYWNLMVNLGAHKGIALLCAYAMSCASTMVGPNSTNAWITSLTVPSFGDDTPMYLGQIKPMDIYGILEGYWSYTESDDDPRRYRTTGRYEQRILSSFDSGSHNFYDYLVNRFCSGNLPIVRSVQRGRMGSSSTHSYSRSGGRVPVECLTLIGAALQLSAEYKVAGCFAGWGDKGAVHV